MLEHLFGSRTRVRLLRIFFSDAEKRFYVRELTRLLAAQINAVRRELENLQKAGIIAAAMDESETASDDPHEAKRKYYRLDPRYALYNELRGLLMKSHVLGEESLVQTLTTGNGVRYILFTGVFMNTETPVDLLVVGDITERRINKIISDFEIEYGFPVRYTVMSARDFQERRQLMDRFIYSVLDAPHEIALDSLTVI